MANPLISEANVLPPRITHLREKLRSATRYASGEKIRIYTEAWKETEGDPLDIRWARMLAKFLCEGAITIREGELIVGSQTKYTMGASPELQYRADLANDLREKKFTLLGEKDFGEVTRDEYDSIMNNLEFWKGKSVYCRARNRAYDIFGKELDGILKTKVVVMENSVPVSNGGSVVDFKKVLTKGIKGVIGEVNERIAEITFTHPDDMQKYEFYKAVLLTLEAVIQFARRHAELADQMSKREKNPVRRHELEEIARICRKVPEYPAETFHEAVQSYWFTYLCAFFESQCNCGRLDQYLYPYYKNDMKNGRITLDSAAELLASLWIKFNELTFFYSKHKKENTQGSLTRYVEISGMTPDGDDATNELSFLILEVERRLKLREPAIALCYHPKIDQALLLKGIEANVDTGGGIPAFLNVGDCSNHFVDYGFSLEDARDIVFTGCVHPYGNANSAHLFTYSITGDKVFELALNNGVDPLTGKQVGPATGDPTTFQSIDELYEAFKAQFRYWVKVLSKLVNIHWLVEADTCRVPFHSALMNDCIRKGRDIFAGGLRYPQCNLAGGCRGIQNVANSMMAIESLVFRDKKIKMVELLKALRDNFEGWEELRQRLLSQAKWGNDDDEADRWHAALWEFTGRECQNADILDQSRPGIVRRGGAAFHYISGKSCGAFPDGRKAGEAMADGSVSPAAGTDHKGPTAVINSALKLNQGASIDNLFNMKFPPHLLRSDENRKKLTALIKTYFDGGGYHIQFNMIDKETLIDAKRHPENHRDLVVRVAGFSAYFVDLTAAVQDDIIARTEQTI
jgi:pyruvate formate-lyase/glycerol dehydratase family glycyl radical enzyme